VQAISTDPDRIKAVTANFFFWQGLRWVPMGFTLILFALIPYAKSSIAEPWLSIFAYGLMALALWLSMTVAGRYYARTYGSVRGMPGLHTRRTRIKWLLVYPAMFAAMLLDWKLDAPIFISGLVFALSVEAYRRSTGGGRKHYVIAALLQAAIAFVPLTQLATSRQLLVPFLGLLGAIYVVGGLLDHRELATILRPAPQLLEDDGGAV
jgi:hypothetical protein